MAYSTAIQIKKYCKLLEIDLDDAVLIDYAEGEEKDKLNPILLKQYSLTDIQTMVTSATESGKFIQILSAKLGALAAAKAVYTSTKKNQLKHKIEELEKDVNNTLKKLKVGEIRLL
jgi:MinD-like ATPase involved in chromosome partitioning or flagellar assembly